MLDKVLTDRAQGSTTSEREDENAERDPPGEMVQGGVGGAGREGKTSTITVGKPGWGIQSVSGNPESKDSAMSLGHHNLDEVLYPIHDCDGQAAE